MAVFELQSVLCSALRPVGVRNAQSSLDEEVHCDGVDSAEVPVGLGSHVVAAPELASTSLKQRAFLALEFIGRKQAALTQRGKFFEFIGD